MEFSLPRSAALFPWYFALFLGCGDDGSSSSASAGSTTASSTASATSSTSASQASSTTPDPGDSSSTGTAPTPIDVEPWAEILGEPFDVSVSAVQTVYEPPVDFDLGSFPKVLGVPRSDGTPGARVIVSFSENEDDSQATLVRRTLATTDLGESYVDAEDVPVTNATVLANGTILSVDFVPVWEKGASTAVLSTWRSDDGGLSWAEELAEFDAGEQIRGLRFHRGLLQVAGGPDDGLLLVAYYALLGSDVARSVGLAASHDGGSSWTRWGTIISTDDPTLDHNETTVAYASNRELVAVTRVQQKGTGLLELRINRSADDGRTFSAPTPIELEIEPKGPMPRVGVDPGLTLFANGVMGLTGGREDNWAVFSGDHGNTWQKGRITYVNYSANHRFHGSSGYGGLALTSAHRALLVGDNCANSWGCPETDSGWTVDGEHRIWQRVVDVRPRDPGRLNLATEVAQGTVSVMTDLSPEEPKLGVLAAFDGLLVGGSALRGAGLVELDLGGPRQVTRLGIAGAAGTTAAKVLLFDGAEWFDPGITSTIGGDLALRSFSPPSPRSIERVQILTEEGGGLSEIELYTTTNSFENEALDSPPRAASAASLASTVLIAAEQAVRLHDTSSEQMARLVFPFEPDASSARFSVRAIDLPGPYLFGLTDKFEASMVHLSLDKHGEVRQYNTEDKVWLSIAPPGTVDPFVWVEIELGTHGVTVDGVDLATAPIRQATPGSVYVTSNGTEPVGVDLLLDDLRFGADSPMD